MDNLKTKKSLYILIAIVTLSLAIFIVLLNYYYVYRNVNRIQRVAINTGENVDLASRSICNAIKQSPWLALLVRQDAIARAKEKCAAVPV